MRITQYKTKTYATVQTNEQTFDDLLPWFVIPYRPVQPGPLIAMRHIINARTRNNSAHKPLCLYTYTGFCIKDA